MRRNELASVFFLYDQDMWWLFRVAEHVGGPVLVARFHIDPRPFVRWTTAVLSAVAAADVSLIILHFRVQEGFAPWACHDLGATQRLHAVPSSLRPYSTRPAH